MTKNFDKWFKEVIKIYAKPSVTYDGFVLLCGEPRKGAKKEVYRPSKQTIKEFEKNMKRTYKKLFKEGFTPSEAYDAMF